MMQVEKAQQRVAEQQQRCQAYRDQITAVDEAIVQACAEQQAMMQDLTHNVMHAHYFSAFLNRQKKARQMAERQLVQETHRLKIVQEELRQVALKQKSLELLKDKEYQKYKVTVEKLEEAFLSELAIQRSAYQSKG